MTWLRGFLFPFEPVTCDLALLRRILDKSGESPEVRTPIVQAGLLVDLDETGETHDQGACDQ